MLRLYSIRRKTKDKAKCNSNKRQEKKNNKELNDYKSRPSDRVTSLFGLNCNRYATCEAAEPHLQQNLMNMSCQGN